MLILLLPGLEFCMTTTVIIDDKFVSVNPVSFGAHFVSRVKIVHTKMCCKASLVFGKQSELNF